MAFNVSLGTLVRRSQQRCDQEGEDLVDKPEWKANISAYFAELHALVVDKGASYFQTEATINLAALALPADHLASIGVDEVIDGNGTRRTVTGPLPVQLRSRYIGLTGGQPAVHWGFEGSALALYPLPTVGTYKHLYIPQPTDYSASADTTVIDVINIYGHNLIVWGAASIAQHKSKDSQDRSLGEYQKAVGEVEYWACKRAAISPSYRVEQDDWARYDGRRYVDVADFSVTRP